MSPNLSVEYSKIPLPFVGLDSNFRVYVYNPIISSHVEEKDGENTFFKIIYLSHQLNFYIKIKHIVQKKYKFISYFLKLL